MRVHVEGNYYISGEKMDYALEEKSIVLTGKQKGQEIIRRVSNHATVAQAATALLRIKIGESTATNLRELIDDVARIETYLMTKISF